MLLFCSPFLGKWKTARACQGQVNSRVSMPAAKCPSKREMVCCRLCFGEPCYVLQWLGDTNPFLASTVYLFSYVFLHYLILVPKLSVGKAPFHGTPTKVMMRSMISVPFPRAGKIKGPNYWKWSGVLVTTESSELQSRKEIKTLWKKGVWRFQISHPHRMFPIVLSKSHWKTDNFPKTSVASVLYGHIYPLLFLPLFVISILPCSVPYFVSAVMLIENLELLLMIIIIYCSVNTILEQ